MKKGIKYLLLLVASFFILERTSFLILDLLHQKSMYGESGGKINNLVKNHNKTEILFVGDSRNAFHVNPKYINNKCYNLSHNGMSIVFQTGLIDQLLTNEQLEIDTLCLHVTFKELNQIPKSQKLDIQFLKYYYNSNEWIKSEINKYLPKGKIKFFFPSFCWNGNVMSIISNGLKFKRQNDSNNGYSPKLPTINDSINVIYQQNQLNIITIDSSKNKLLENQMTNQNFKKYIYSVSQLNQIYISHIDSLCKKNKIVFICYTSPKYNRPYISDSSKFKVINYFKFKNILFLDYSNLYHQNSDFRNINIWNDVYHMNDSGATIFSKNLRKELNNY